MPISANHIAMVRQRTFIPWTIGNGFFSDSNDDLRMALGSAVNAEITLGVGGILLDNTTKTCNFNIPIPTNWDRKNRLRFTVVYSNGAATSGSVDLDLNYDTLGFNALIGAGPSSGTWGGTPTAVNHTSTTANSLLEFGQFVMASETLDDEDYFLRMRVKRKASGSTMSIYVIGLEVEYTPKYYKGYKVESPEYSSKRNN